VLCTPCFSSQNVTGLDECSSNANCNTYCRSGGTPFCSCAASSCLIPPARHTNAPIDRNFSICCCQFHVIAGRPFMVDGLARTADAHHGPRTTSTLGWADSAIAAQLCNSTVGPEPVRRAVANKWVEYGLAEHASVASFSRHSLQLLALGAPSTLVEQAHLAALDEVRHARICFGMAEFYSASNADAMRGPGPLDVAGALPTAGTAIDAGDVLLSVIEEGVVGETVAAVEAAIASRLAEDPPVAAAFREIANDEARHAKLGWAFVQWRLSAGAASESSVRSAVATALQRKADSLDRAANHPLASQMQSHGILSSTDRELALKQSVAVVIDPALNIVTLDSPVGIHDLVWAAADEFVRVSAPRTSCTTHTLIAEPLSIL
jgi:hypothetical protein